MGGPFDVVSEGSDVEAMLEIGLKKSILVRSNCFTRISSERLFCDRTAIQHYRVDFPEWDFRMSIDKINLSSRQLKKVMWT